MKITEKDLYKFVFYSNELSQAKLDFIQLNIAKFKDSLDILFGMKANINDEPPFNSLNKIYDKIDALENESQITLELVDKEEDSEYLVLAADSPSTESSTSTKTYQDAKNKFLAKVISTKECNKIYLFQRYKNRFSDIEITLSPSNESFIMNLNDSPYIIKPNQTIDKITLKFN